MHELFLNQFDFLRGQDDYQSSSFPIKRRVKQGCPLSPSLFNAILQIVMERWQIKMEALNLGVFIGEHRLTELRFADDIMLFAKTESDAILMLKHLVYELRVAGLELKPKKSKLITSVPHIHDFASMHDGTLIDIIPNCEGHRWLGRILSGTKGFTHCLDIDSRISAATRAFYRLRPILCNRSCPIPMRLKYFQATVS